MRVAAAVPFIGVQSFKWALDNGQWRARIATIQSGFDAAAREAGKDPGDVAFVRRVEGSAENADMPVHCQSNTSSPTRATTPPITVGSTTAFSSTG